MRTVSFFTMFTQTEIYCIILSMAKKKRKKKKNNQRIWVIVFIVLLVIDLILLVPVMKRQIAKKATGVIVDSAISEISSSGVLTEEQTNQLSELIENLPEEQQEQVVDIVENHLDVSTVSELTDIAQNGNTQDLLEYAQSELTDEEMQTLLDIAAMYGYTLTEEE